MGAEGGRGSFRIEDVEGARAVAGVAGVKRFVTLRVGHCVVEIYFELVIVIWIYIVESVMR